MKVLSIEAVYEDERKAPNHRAAATLSMEEEIWQRRREKISTVILKILIGGNVCTNHF